MYKAGKPVAACEANVYNVQGSKPTEIIRSYAHLNDLLNQREMAFFWFTDGPAWNDMWPALEGALTSFDYVMSYTIGSRATKTILQSLVK
ncbi:MAG: DpnII family type II restriction endonuclease [Rhabdochlamydiaceae bacterium]